MLNLNDREWKAFKVKDIFLIEKCKCSSVSTLKPGDFPYVGATNRNNGIMSFVEKKDKWTTKGNCIVFICDGQGSVGYSIYKKEDFIGSTTLKVGRSEHLNRYTAQFLVSALDKNRPMYSYGYKRNENRLSNESIMLPTAKNGQPDYAFMEQYIREREDKLKQKYIDFANTEFVIPPVPLTEKTYGVFWLKDLFNIIQRGKRLVREYQQAGTMPYVSSTAMNNGIDGFISTERITREFSNCLTIANSGSVGSSFYQPSNFIASDHITHLKNDNYTMYVYLFIATMTRRMSDKYNFNREINDYRISKEKILLPTTDDGIPDYEYMEQYIKAIMFAKYKKYLEYQNCLTP